MHRALLFFGQMARLADVSGLYFKRTDAAIMLTG